MSKIGKRPIKIEEGVEITITENLLTASCNGKTQEVTLPREIAVEQVEDMLIVKRHNDTKIARSLHGLIARLSANAIHGVKEGFIKELIFTGTGYRAAAEGRSLLLNMGYSHEIKMEIPEDLEVKVAKNSIIISGIDKSHVGQFAASVRDVRPPEPYKGKGIRYKDEHIRRKAGKTAASK